MKPRIELVIFDLGRVMIRLVDGWSHACARAGVPYHPRYESPQIRDALTRLIYLSEIGKLDPEAWSRSMAELIDLTPGQVDAISRAWLTGPYPGWDGLLDRLATARVKTSCLSNTSARHWELMHEPGSANYLPLKRLSYRFASHLIGAHKPEAAIYRHVEEVTGVDPRAILFFDDVGANVEAARKHGWSAEVIDPHQDPVMQVATHLHSHGVL